MSGLTFAQPAWFWGLLVLFPLAALRAWAHWHASRRLPGLVAPRLATRLISGSSHSRRWTVFTLHCLALVATIAALARPILGFTEIETETDARNLIIAIDTSRSMMANDLPPNRLTRAQLAAKDIILSLPEDRVGLIAFAGRPFVQAPLTVDHEAVLEAIDQLDTEIIPRGGTNLSAATALALETFKEAKLEHSALVLFSDGEALEGLEEVEKIRDEAGKKGMSIITVGVGTAEGAIIPEVDDNGDPVPGLFVKDDQGQVVRTRLVAEALQSLSSGGGTYVHLGGKASLTRVVEQIRQGLTSSREESETRLRPIERFVWPLSAAVAFLVLAHLLPLFWLKPSPGRPLNPALVKRLAAALTIFGGSLLLTTGPVSARDSIRTGYEAYQTKDFATAIEVYEGTLTERLTAKDRARLHMSIGAAAYRLGNFERAAEAYGDALVEGNKTLRSQTHYNLGNTLFRQGEAGLKPAPQTADSDQLQNLSGKEASLENTIRDWEASIEHFETTLSLDPDNQRATHNLDLVKKRLEELKKQQEEEQDEKKEDEKKEDEKKEDEKKEEEKKDDEEKEDEEKKDDKGQKEEPKDENGDGKPDDQEDPGEEDPQNPDGEQPQDDQSPQDPKEGEGENPDPNAPSEKPESGEGEAGDEKPPQNPGENQPEQPDAPQDGELEANPNTPQQPQGQPGQAQAAEKKMNPATGYSPSEARQLLESLADETEVRPLVQPSRGEKFKNW
jgi:Ca-activated chloride channel family protein